MKKLFESLGDCLDEGISCLTHFIERYGEVRLLVDDKLDPDDNYFDFVLFCITKSVRSLNATIELIGASYSQDALILLRTVYENYLTASFTYSNPQKLSEVFQKKLGLSIGLFTEIKNSKGKRIRGKLRDTLSDSVIDHENISTYQLAKESEFNSDYEIHKELYKYLSEFVHPNMISSGSYRDETTKFYTVKSESNNAFTPMWISAYLVTVILQQVIDHFEVDSNDQKIFTKTHSTNVMRLKKFCSRMTDELESEKAKVFELIIKRLNDKAKSA